MIAALQPLAMPLLLALATWAILRTTVDAIDRR
jgi:hypothetical protein